MAKGETSFNLASLQKKKRDRTPFPAGDYDLKIVGSTIEIKTPEQKPNKPPPMPYVNFAFEALGTQKEEGGKNRRVYHSLWLSLKPDSNGDIGPALVDQLRGLGDALGDVPSLPTVTVNGEQILDPIAVKEWLQSHDGEVVRAHVRIQAASGNHPASNRVEEFFEQVGATSPADADEDDDEDEEAEEEAEETEDEDEEDEEEDEDELEKAAKKAKKPAGKKSKK